MLKLKRKMSLRNVGYTEKEIKKLRSIVKKGLVYINTTNNSISNDKKKHLSSRSKKLLHFLTKKKFLFRKILKKDALLVKNYLEQSPLLSKSKIGVTLNPQYS
jgi:hypothetical protein